MKMIHAPKLIELLRDAGLTGRSYGGRGMRGARCVGVFVPDGDLLTLGARLAGVVVAEVGTQDGRGRADAEDAVATVVSLMGEARQDSMGRAAVVVYWPDRVWPEDACPGCGCEPGDGRTKGCADPDGCGHNALISDAALAVERVDANELEENAKRLRGSD